MTYYWLASVWHFIFRPLGRCYFSSSSAPWWWKIKNQSPLILCLFMERWKTFFISIGTCITFTSQILTILKQILTNALLISHITVVWHGHETSYPGSLISFMWCSFILFINIVLLATRRTKQKTPLLAQSSLRLIDSNMLHMKLVAQRKLLWEFHTNIVND